MGSVFIEDCVDTDAAFLRVGGGEPAQAIGFQRARSHHVHGHAARSVRIGELANEVGERSVGDAGAARLRCGLGSEMPADGDDSGVLDKPVVDGADEAEQAADF